MAQFKFLLWLAYWYQQSEAFDFEWDSGNSQKNSKKHSVTMEEVEEIFTLKMAIPVGRQITPIADEERLCLIGPTSVGRILSVVFTLRGNRVRPISGRTASRKERALYEKINQAIKNL